MTKDEILAELLALLATQPDPEGYYSTAEWGEMLGVSSSAAIHRRLKVAKQAGRLDVVKVKVPSNDGRLMISYRYRVVPERAVKLA